MSFSFEFEGPANTQYTSPSALARPRRTYQSVSSMARGPMPWPMRDGRSMGPARGLWVQHFTLCFRLGFSRPVSRLPWLRATGAHCPFKDKDRGSLPGVKVSGAKGVNRQRGLWLLGPSSCAK